MVHEGRGQIAATVRVLAAAGLLAALLLWIAPPERTLGTGIRWVYLHVSLIWTGIAGFGVVSLLGLLVLVRGDERMQAWAQTAGWVAAAFFAVGFLTSMVASKINWGAVFLAEPRNRSALMFLSVALIVLILGMWPLPLRLKGLLYTGLIVLFAWSNLTTPLVLHPKNPIRTSDSLAIQASFLALFLVFSAAAGWLVVTFGRGGKG